MSGPMQARFDQLRQGMVDSVKAQAAPPATTPGQSQAGTDDDRDSLALVIDGVGMLLTYRAEVSDSCAFVFTDFGSVAPEAELAALRRLLEINFLMYRGGAPAFTRDPDSGHILLLCEVPLEIATADSVLVYLRQLAAHAQQWRQGHYLDPHAGPGGGVLPLMA